MKTVALKNPNTGEFTMMQLTGFGSISADDRAQYAKATEFTELKEKAVQIEADDIPDLSIIQYNKSIGEWEAVSDNEFVDSVIDGGEADSDSEYVAAFDIDGTKDKAKARNYHRVAKFQPCLESGRGRNRVYRKRNQNEGGRRVHIVERLGLHR
jgi:hypothetical protein